MLNICNEAARCLLCGDAACTAACSKGYDPAGMLRSIRFGNPAGAVWKVDGTGCASCDGACEQACRHYDFRCGSGRRRQPCQSGVPSRI